MELKHGRVHDKCSDCGAEILVGPIETIMSTIEATGYAGVAPVMLHRLPLCSAMKEQAKRAWKEIRERAEDATAEAAADEREAEDAARRAREEARRAREDARTQTKTPKTK
jgi:hypothetical protein